MPMHGQGEVRQTVRTQFFSADWHLGGGELDSYNEASLTSLKDTHHERTCRFLQRFP